jgi:Helix-turn-helix domain
MPPNTGRCAGTHRLPRWAQGVKATCTSIDGVGSRGACGAVVGWGEGTDRGAGRGGGTVWRLRQVVPLSRYAIHRAVRRPLAQPAPEPTRSALRLSLAEREEISRGLARGESLRGIARRLGRASSTVSREVARNGVRAGDGACQADRVALRLMRRPKVAKLARCARLRAIVESLELRWSPQQIAGWLSVEFPDDAEMRVS